MCLIGLGLQSHRAMLFGCGAVRSLSNKNAGDIGDRQRHHVHPLLPRMQSVHMFNAYHKCIRSTLFAVLGHSAQFARQVYIRFALSFKRPCSFFCIFGTILYTLLKFSLLSFLAPIRGAILQQGWS